MTRNEYDTLRRKFFHWACEQGLSVGNDEAGYNDDEPAADALWKQWLAGTQKPDVLTPNVADERRHVRSNGG